MEILINHICVCTIRLNPKSVIAQEIVISVIKQALSTFNNIDNNNITINVPKDE